MNVPERPLDVLGKHMFVGRQGTIGASSGSQEVWRRQESGTTVDLYDVHFADRYTGWAVGVGGTILKTTRGGW